MKRFALLTGLFGLLLTPFVGSADGQFSRPTLFKKSTPVLVAAPQQTIPAPGTVAAGESKKIGPAACVAIRVHVAKELRKKDPTLSVAASLKKAREIAGDEEINAAAVEAEKLSGQKFGAFGDGTIFQKLIDFLNSPAGKALIDALIQILIHSISFNDVVPSHYYVLYLDDRDRIYQFTTDLAA